MFGRFDLQPFAVAATPSMFVCASDPNSCYYGFSLLGVDTGLYVARSLLYRVLSLVAISCGLFSEKMLLCAVAGRAWSIISGYPSNVISPAWCDNWCEAALAVRDEPTSQFQ